jgi:FkbM family methyltransferase
MRDFEAVPIDEVRDFWNNRPCNIRHSPQPVGSREYFDEVEARKYFVEPHIVAFADFPRWKGRRVLEIGCGIGTATISFLRAGAQVTAVDLSPQSLELAKQRAELYGFADRVTFFEADAERLSETVPPQAYDLVYSFGVLHHTPHPERAINQIRSFVRPGTTVKLMMYYSRSWKVFWAVLRYGGGRFWDWRRIIAKYSEAQTGCPVTYTYTKGQLKQLLESRGFRVTDVFVDHIFPYSIPEYVAYQYRKVWYFRWMPHWLFRWLERHFGWHLCVTAVAENVPSVPLTQHPAFRAFDVRPRTDGAPGFAVNFLGQKTNVEFGLPSAAAAAEYVPEASEESYEWIAVLDAVAEAKTTFTMFELGAGYGRWLVAAVCAARQRRPDMTFKLVAVEPEPTHFQYLRQHFSDNGLNPDDFQLIEAAVNASGEPASFIVGQPREWYGQAIVPEGFRMRDYPMATTVRVPAVKLVDLLEPHDYVDLLDADIQGAELEVVQASITAIGNKVRRAYISTHSKEIHKSVADIFREAGWIAQAMHGWTGGPEATQFGTVPFIDGIQYWLNPRMARGRSAVAH